MFYFSHRFYAIKNLSDYLTSKSPISRLKSTSMKTLKIGLNKRLFKKKKSATNAEILKMVRNTVQLSD